MAEKSIRIIINGKSAADPKLRTAVSEFREQGFNIEVRVTWEAGDASRYAYEAVQNKLDVVVAAGGDGTINEVSNGLLQNGPQTQTALAVIPYGTANDFATGIGIAKDNPQQALEYAAKKEPTLIDVGQVNDRLFINVASGGFGAEVTANTPPELKKAIGGAAYSLMGIVTAAKMNPYECKFSLPDGRSQEGKVLIMAVGNGRQCGGGYQVTPEASLNDGLLDVIVVHDVEVAQLGQLLNELFDPAAEANQFIVYKQVPSFTLESVQPFQLNLDGEPYRDNRFEFKVLPQSLPVILGPNAPVAEA